MSAASLVYPYSWSQTGVNEYIASFILSQVYVSYPVIPSKETVITLSPLRYTSPLVMLLPS